MNEKKSLITSYITKLECQYMCDTDLFNCESCSNIEECLIIAHSKCTSEYIKSIDYGGCDSEEDFLEQLYS